MMDKTEQQYKEELIRCVKTFEELEIRFESMEKHLRLLEAENDFLRRENAEYQRKFSRITESKLGKIGLKIYRCFTGIRQKGK